MGVQMLSGRVFLVALTLASLQACSDSAENSQKVTSSDCWIDSINNNVAPVVDVKAGAIYFKGWAADSSTGTAPKDMGVYIVDASGNKVLFKTDKRVSRADVATEKKQPKYEMSGFEVSADAGSLKVGEHTLSLVMFRDGATVTCATPTKLIISKR